MKIAVIGATGYVGRAVIKELAARGHDVTAFARHTETIATADNIHAVAADVNDAAFASQLEGFDAVVSAFNPGWSNPDIGADFARGAEAITAAAKAAAVPYLLVVGGAGSLYVAPGVQLVDTPQFPPEIFDGANAARNLLADLRDRRDVNWAFISPPAAFYEGSPYQAGGQYRMGKDDVLMEGDAPAGIHVDDLARAIADDAEKKAHLFQRFTVAAVLA